MAEQSAPVRRKVALKVIKAGMDSGQVLARFEAERQALALMDHPNIATVLDAGATSDGRPYVVMELVKGAPITAYRDANRLPPRDRLALFADVCAAVQRAHQKGVIHRDLKPSNVLVGLYDGKPVVKVIDFGVAKAAGQPLTDRTLFTGVGAVVGTPEYMSPEQATLDNLDVDTRSDVYTLGVLLYELLTGTTPGTRDRVKRAALLEVLRVVREEDTPRPSTRLSGTESRASIAAVRGMEPGRLSRLLRGGTGLGSAEGAGEGPRPAVRDRRGAGRGRPPVPGRRAGGRVPAVGVVPGAEVRPAALGGPGGGRGGGRGAGGRGGGERVAGGGGPRGPAGGRRPVGPSSGRGPTPTGRRRGRTTTTGRGGRRSGRCSPGLATRSSRRSRR